LCTQAVVRDVQEPPHCAKQISSGHAAYPQQLPPVQSAAPHKPDAASDRLQSFPPAGVTGHVPLAVNGFGAVQESGGGALAEHASKPAAPSASNQAAKWLRPSVTRPTRYRGYLTGEQRAGCGSVTPRERPGPCTLAPCRGPECEHPSQEAPDLATLPCGVSRSARRMSTCPS
jgi:hypothetical protein